MFNKYLISITGYQTIDGYKDKIELTTIGSYVKKGDTRYIVYDEYEDEPIESKKITTILKIRKNSVTLIKNSNGHSRMLLEKGKRHQCYYNLGLGMMNLGVYTSYLKSTLNDFGGTLEIDYSLDLNSNITSFNQIHIKIWRAKNKNVKDSDTN